MSRPPKQRRVEYIPEVTLFKPAGIPAHELDSVTLTVEEVEAIRLKDMEGLEQEQCAEKMHVSRPTFYRILKSAREKLATALICGKAIYIEGGVYKLAQRQFRCKSCDYEFSLPFGHGQTCAEVTCPECGAPNSEVVRLDKSGHPCPRQNGFCSRRT
ncbi:MAG: DUF134 domain-containing protein [Firmicutes bacterium]|nr:DUF134 domain-containing protein [Bacillota bacterium]